MKMTTTKSRKKERGNHRYKNLRLHPNSMKKLSLILKLGRRENGAKFKI